MNLSYLIGKTDVGTNDIPIKLIDKRHYFPYLFVRDIGIQIKMCKRGELTKKNSILKKMVVKNKIDCSLPNCDI